MITSRRRWLGAALLTTLPILLNTSQASAEAVISKSYQYYSIGGKTAEALDRELSRRGPKSANTGNHHAGLTQIKFTYEISYADKVKSCSIAGVKVKLAAKIILPRWRYRNQADSHLRFVWDTLAADIKRHEERHAEIARNHARKMEKSLARLSSARDCDTLEKKAERVVERAIRAHDKDQVRFDRLESSHFEQRMIRLLKNRTQRKN